MTRTNKAGKTIYAPCVGLRNHQFADTQDICELMGETERAREARRQEAMSIGGWL